MQPQRAIPAIVQQPVQLRQRGEPEPRAAGLERLVHQLRVDPVEQRQVEEQVAVLVRQVAQQPLAQKVGGEALVAPEVLRGAARGLAGPQVAEDLQGDGPSLRPLHQRLQIVTRQTEVEEAGDLGRREAKLRGPHAHPGAGQHRGVHVQAGIAPAPDGDVQVRGSVAQQAVDRLDRFGVRRPVRVVEDQQAAVRVGLDRLGQQRGLVIAAARRPGRGHLEIQARAVEGVGEVGAQDARRVVLGQRQPGGDPAPFAQPAAEIGQQRGLAEPSRRLQDGDPALPGRRDPVEQLRAPEVAAHPFRGRHPRGQQPGRHRGGGVR